MALVEVGSNITVPVLCIVHTRTFLSLAAEPRHDHRGYLLRMSNNGGRAPSFSGRGGGRGISSLQAHDLTEGSGGGRGGGRFGGRGRGGGRGKRVLNGNFMNGGRDRGGPGAAETAGSGLEEPGARGEPLPEDRFFSDDRVRFFSPAGRGKSIALPEEALLDPGDSELNLPR